MAGVTLVVLVTTSHPVSSAVSSASVSPTGRVPTPATPSQQVCGGPIVITKGGTYSGCWISNQQGAALTIATSAPVTITNSTIRGTARLVESSVGHVKVAIDHTRLYGLYPGGRNRWGDYAVRLVGFDSFRFEHNYIEQKGGIQLLQWSGVPTDHAVLVRYNSAKNIDGRLTDGAGGYSGRVITQFLQLDAVQNAPGVEISWNEVHNTPNASAVEDNINVFMSSGTESSPIDIHDNFIDGAYPYPAASKSFNGGGILLADAGGSYQIAHGNQVISTTNYGIANASGTHTSIYANRVVASGVLADGTAVIAMNVGIYSWNQYDAAYGDNSVYDNVSGWMDNHSRRNDWWLPDCGARCTGNTHLQNNSLPTTRADEANEYASWQRKLASAGIKVGP